MRAPRSLLALAAASAIALAGDAARAQSDDDFDDGFYQPPQDGQPGWQGQGQGQPGWQGQGQPGWQGQGQPGWQGQPGQMGGYPQQPGFEARGPVTYVGIHPVPHDVGAGFCGTSGAHTHAYQPFDSHLFRRASAGFYFVGDPYDFGYAQPLHWYRGHHPIPAEFGDGICFMSWPHRHQYAPPVALQPYYHSHGGYFMYRGPWNQDYDRWRNRYVGYFNNYYRSYYFGNRYYRVRPRHVYMGGWGGGWNRGGWGGGWGNRRMGGGGYAAPPVPPPGRVYGVPPAPPPVRVYAPPPAPAYGGQNYVPAPPAYGGGRGGFVPPPAPASR